VVGRAAKTELAKMGAMTKPVEVKANGSQAWLQYNETYYLKTIKMVKGALFTV